MMRPLLLPLLTRLARTMACMRPWALSGLSKYMAESDFTSKPVTR